MQYLPEQFAKRIGGYRITDIKQAIESEEILEANVIKCDKDLNTQIQLGNNLIGVIPADEFEYSIDGRPMKSVAVLSKVGKSVKFKVMSAFKGTDGIYKIELSRKMAQKECYENYISKLELGQVIDARVTYVESYGAFCDIGCGITALLPIENICISRVANPSRDLKAMRNIKAVVKSIIDGKITLTHKELLGTWSEEASKFQAGDTVTGTVRVIEDYGVFVELTPNLVGLADVYPDISAGDEVSVYIKSIIPDKMKIKLLIINKNDRHTGSLHFNYKLPQNGFIYDWYYSPKECSKKFETHIERN